MEHLRHHQAEAVFLPFVGLEPWRRVRTENGGPLLYAYGPMNALDDRVRAARLAAAGYVDAPLDMRQVIPLVRQRLACDARGPFRVLLVDSDRESAAALSMTLASDDVLLASAHDAAAMMHAVEASPPDLILLASGLRSVSAVDLVAVLRTHSYFRNVPCALLVEDAKGESRAQYADADAIFRRDADTFILRSRLLMLLERGRRERQLRAMDVSTGVLTHAALLRATEREIATAGRGQSTLAVIRLEVNNPIRLRLTRGADALDLAQRILARAMRETLRQSDIVGQLCDNVFLGLLPACDTNSARERITAIREQFHTNILRHASLNDVTLCAGAADTSGGLEDVLSRADRELLASWGGGPMAADDPPSVSSALPFQRGRAAPLVAVPGPEPEPAPSTGSTPASDEEVVCVDDADGQVELSRAACLVQVGWSVRGDRTVGNHRQCDIVVPEVRAYPEQAFLTLDYARITVGGKRGRIELMQEGEASITVGESKLSATDAIHEARVEIIRRDTNLEPDFNVPLQFVPGAILPDPRAQFLEVDVTQRLVAALFTLGLARGEARSVRLGPASATLTYDGERARITNIVCPPDGRGLRPLFIRAGAHPWRLVPADESALSLEPGDAVLVGNNVYRFDIS
ncbi:hypothetical protein LBMAG42_34810 [Deltaproteobacteria bacterium]|nr:hypothetical protein LBMAG42_34810 [Deltaproteobacteria bacterium]